MPKKIDTTHVLMERQLVVYQRPNSDVWQCRYKVAGKWIVATTKERELSKAKERAQRLLIAAEIRKESSLPVITKYFKDIARLAKQRMVDEAALGDVPVSYADYTRIIDDYLVPFFGKKAITSLTQADLNEFAVWREEKMKKVPAYSTVRSHNVTLNRVFDEAVKRGFVTHTYLPKLETKGKPAEKYPTFTIPEVNAMLANFGNWIATAKTEKSKQQRQLMFDYVRVLLDTGARPGKELLNVQWKQIEFKITDRVEPIRKVDDEGRVSESADIGFDEEHHEIEKNWVKDFEVFLYVDGKTGGRHVLGKEETYKTLKAIAARNYDGAELKELVKKKDQRYVFRTKDGDEASSFNHLFERYLRDHNLLLDSTNGRKRVFYSLRSTYTTYMLDLDQASTRDLSHQLGNSPTMIHKHYDRSSTKQTAKNLAGKETRNAFFNFSETNEIYAPVDKRSAKASKNIK